MKLASFVAEGRNRYGVVTGDTILDLADAFPDAPDLATLLASPGWRERAEGARGRSFTLSEVAFLPVNPRRDAKILALGWAYVDHRAETGRAPDAFPSFFMMHQDALCGHGRALRRPSISDAFDFEGELAVVIGKEAHRITEADALGHVAGYTVLMDGSIRDWQKHGVTAGKNFDGLTPCGPWMVTTDEIPDPRALELTTRLNGTVMQHTSVGELIWPVEYLVAYCSSFTTLRPGDIISTGTPGGVGHKRTPQLFMKPGDVIEVEVSRIGVLRNEVAAEEPRRTGA